MSHNPLKFQSFKLNSPPKRTFAASSDNNPTRTVSDVLCPLTTTNSIYEEETKTNRCTQAFNKSVTAVAVINLFNEGFAFDNQDTQYAWSSELGEELVFVLDHSLLTPAFSKLLSTAQVKFENGGAVVEVRDYRGGRDNEPSSYEGKPNIFRMSLQSTQHTLLADLEAELNNEEDLLKAEEKILKTLHPLCIDPSPDVFHVNSNTHYNKSKFFLSFSNDASSVKHRLVAKRKRVEPRVPSATEQQRRKRPRMGVIPFLQKIGQKPGVVALLEPTFHKQQQDVVFDTEKKIDKSDKVPPVREPGKQPIEKISRKPWAELQVPQYHQTPLQKRMLRFKVNKGQDFVLFEIMPKPNGCYDGRLRVGTCPDTGSNGEFSERFSIGNAKGAQAFLKTIRDLEALESNGSAPEQFSSSSAGMGQPGGHPAGVPNNGAVGIPGAIRRAPTGPGHQNVQQQIGIPQAQGQHILPPAGQNILSHPTNSSSMTVPLGQTPGGLLQNQNQEQEQDHQRHQPLNQPGTSQPPIQNPAGGAASATNNNQNPQNGGRIYPPTPTLLNAGALRNTNPAHPVQLSQRLSGHTQVYNPHSTTQTPNISSPIQHLPTQVPATEQTQQFTQPSKVISTRSRSSAPVTQPLSEINQAHTPHENMNTGTGTNTHHNEEPVDEMEDDQIEEDSSHHMGEEAEDERKGRNRTRTRSKAAAGATTRKRKATESSPPPSPSVGSSPGNGRGRGSGRRGRPKKTRNATQ